MKKRLADLLEYVVNNVPFYSTLSAKKGLELHDFPILSKRQYIENLEELLSAQYSDHERVSNPGRWSIPKTLACEFTSGSSGYPLCCYKTASERAQYSLSLFKKRRAIYGRFTLDQLYCFIHNTNYVHRKYVDSLGNLTEENIASVLSYLRDEVKPAVLHGNTMLLKYYADFIKKHDFDLRSWRLEFIESVSESISESQKAYIGEAFKAKIFNCYGCLECYNVAYECPYHTLHLNEHVLIEVLDLDIGVPIEDPDAEGELALTSLVNRAQPFIRYKLGDLGRLVPVDCPCGLSRPAVRLSERRKIDYLKLLFKTTDPRLNICGYDVFSNVVHRLVSTGHDYVSWYNVIQSDMLSFQVLFTKKPNFSPAFFAKFQEYTEHELGQKTHIQFVEKEQEEVLHINKKNRVFRSLLQID